MNSIKFFFSLIFIGLFCTLSAQKFQYSYVTDRRFYSPDELIGYTFLPSEKEYTDGDKDEISPGEVIFEITPSGLRITGGVNEGNYNAVSINSTKYGYFVKLMNARNPVDQGHIKFILDANSNVDALVFKKSKDRPEVIYYQEKIQERLDKIENKYFTDLGEIRVAEADSIWGSRVRPFLRINQIKQERLVASDSVYLDFVREEIVKDVKPVVEEEKAKEEVVDEVTTLEGDEDFVITETEEDEATDSDEFEDDDDEFIDDDEWVDEDDPLAGMLKKQKKKKTGKKKKEEEEESDEIEEEEELFDDAELAEIIEEEEEEMEEEKKSKQKKEKKVKEPKTKYKYYIVLRYNRSEGTGEEAVVKEERVEFPVKTWKKKTSPDPKDVDVRHMLEYSTRPNSILVFTDEKNNISKVIIGNVEYLMRGF